MIKHGSLNKLQIEINQLLIDHKIAYQEYLAKSLLQLFKKYLKEQKNV